ncbi:MAG: Rv3654c family TadE-like protein [Marmoricola sp.]
MTRGKPRDADGSVTLFGVFVIGVLTLFTMACVGIAGIVVAHRRAQSAADLGSLAAASAIQRGRSPCAAGADVVRRDGGRLTGCRVRGETVTLRVEIATARIFGRVRHTEASARAGPLGPLGPSSVLAQR